MIKPPAWMLLFLSGSLVLGAAPAELEYGPYPVGFKLIEAVDHTRSYPSGIGSGIQTRPIRVYLWYPASSGEGRALTVNDFILSAAGDFGLPNDRLPVPLEQGLDKTELGKVLSQPLKSTRDLPLASGTFPLLLFGQGLYYESPLSNVVLCEYLAGRGYIVATCPLLGTHYRLVNQSADDLETQVRDLEFVLAEARARTEGKSGRLGIIGYDLGGMAGLVLAMRRPEIEAFLSLDCGILTPHFSGLPASHSSYREEFFAIPWMHMTQARFLETVPGETAPLTLADRKKYGDSWIVAVPAENHGAFTSYATFGIRNAVRGYWAGFDENAPALHDEICRLAGDFFDAALMNHPEAMQEKAPGEGTGGSGLKITYRKGAVPPESSRSLMRRIIDFGLESVRPDLDRLRAADPEASILNEDELRWLAYHFLLWWGRPQEAFAAFRLGVDIFPRSATAWAGLGEAYYLTDRKEEAVAAFRRALEINSDLPNVKAALDGLLERK